MATDLAAPRVRALIPMPDHPYYLWQSLAQIVNLSEFGIRPVYLVYGQDSKPSPLLERLIEETGAVADWHFWLDPRAPDRKTYNPSMKPRLLSMYYDRFGAQPSGYDSTLYLDPDVMVLRIPKGAWLTPGAASNTDSYTGPDYLAHKGVLTELLELAQAPTTLLDGLAGVGAQYVLHDEEDPALWGHIADLSERAYHLMHEGRERFQPDGDEHPVQAWCAEMYLTQIMATQAGRPFVAHPEMDFCWADSPLEETQTATFLHDAGIAQASDEHFCKVLYQVAPWDESGLICPSPSKTSASRVYVDLLNQTVESYPRLTHDWISLCP